MIKRRSWVVAFFTLFNSVNELTKHHKSTTCLSLVLAETFLNTFTRTQHATFFTRELFLVLSQFSLPFFNFSFRCWLLYEEKVKNSVFTTFHFTLNLNSPLGCWTNFFTWNFLTWKSSFFSFLFYGDIYHKNNVWCGRDFLSSPL